jgi:hypothetical protein
VHHRLRRRTRRTIRFVREHGTPRDGSFSVVRPFKLLLRYQKTPRRTQVRSRMVLHRKHYARPQTEHVCPERHHTPQTTQRSQRSLGEILRREAGSSRRNSVEIRHGSSTSRTIAGMLRC